MEKAKSYFKITSWVTEDDQPYVTSETDFPNEMLAVQIAMMIAECDMIKRELLEIYDECEPIVRGTKNDY